ncbi:endo alpha-1,4 polygalactosaminidase [Deinococcus sp. QL22]|uniref:endo alpha-1,4 polygalactosaminidase n=1 Tax=Deinococcus sp. QL22 TaxID=2939437 RepID=UPI00201804AA|nr:endo alpha-1,4 polygalactosaminidase [Deinococcus sp. QL22]UQN09868.1 endo alpha-1,4 polygalactosaminidase [Deinococcus sp. QL22]
MARLTRTLTPPTLPSTEPGERSRSRSALALYYGQDALPLLTRYQRVVVQPGHFNAAQVTWLRQRGVQVLAYLSLGEDGSGQPQDWLTAAPPTIWDTRLVNASHPEWRARVQAQVLRDKAVFSGFFLDTVDSAPQDSRQLRAMLKLVRLVRQWAGPKYLLINRGIGLLHRLRGTVNGVLIEAFSTTWQSSVEQSSVGQASVGQTNAGPAGYRAYTKPELEYTAQLVEQVRRQGLEVYALDYADTPQLRRFALRRAASFGLSTFVSNRELSLPTGYAPPPKRAGAATEAHRQKGLSP